MSPPDPEQPRQGPAAGCRNRFRARYRVQDYGFSDVLGLRGYGV